MVKEKPIVSRPYQPKPSFDSDTRQVIRTGRGLKRAVVDMSERVTANKNREGDGLVVDTKKPIVSRPSIYIPTKNCCPTTTQGKSGPVES
jgi:hypothetical protein